MRRIFMNNNDWIPVSVRLPDEHESMFTKFKGTAKWNENMFERTTKTVLCTVKFSNGMVVTTGRLNDGKWNLDVCEWTKDFKVIAWMSFPDPYVEETDDNKSTQ
jgi:hypothetical protein